MHVSKEFLIEAVGLSLLVVLLMFGMQMFQRATDLIALFDSEQEQQLASLKDYEIMQYDGRSIDGVTAVSYIKNMVGNYKIPIQVETEEKVFVIETEEGYAGLRDFDSEYYMSPFGLYDCDVLRDENGDVEYINMKVKEGE